MARKRNNREFWQSACSNDRTFLMYYNRLTELATSMFEWKNLPDTVDPRYLELTLYAKGQAVFFYDGMPAENPLGYLALNVAASAPFNVYAIPKGRRAYAITGAQWNLDESNSVMIYNNYLRMPSMFEMEYYAQRLWDLDRTIDINARAQKTPILLKCEENQRLTMLNLYKEYDGNAPVIFGDKNLSPNGLQVLATGAEFTADRIYELRTKIWNEALERLGISSIQHKAERLVQQEAAQAQGATIACRYSRLKMRQMACEQINKMFGLNISVEYSQDYQIMDTEEIDAENKESEEEVDE